MRVFNFLERPKGLEVLYHLFTWVQNQSTWADLVFCVGDGELTQTKIDFEYGIKYKNLAVIISS